MKIIKLLLYLLLISISAIIAFVILVIAYHSFFKKSVSDSALEQWQRTGQLRVTIESIEKGRRVLSNANCVAYITSEQTIRTAKHCIQDSGIKKIVFIRNSMSKIGASAPIPVKLPGYSGEKITSLRKELAEDVVDLQLVNKIVGISSYEKIDVESDISVFYHIDVNRRGDRVSPVHCMFKKTDVPGTIFSNGSACRLPQGKSGTPIFALKNGVYYYFGVYHGLTVKRTKNGVKPIFGFYSINR